MVQCAAMQYTDIPNYLLVAITHDYDRVYVHYIGVVVGCLDGFGVLERS